MNLIRSYNQNRKKIWGIVIIIAFAFIFLRLLGYAYDKKNDTLLMANNNSTIPETVTNTTAVNTKRSVVTGEKVTDENLQIVTTIIDEFFSYCNKKELQKAYDLLTEDCKTQKYHTLDIFEQAYYQDVFHGENKTCSIENWVDHTYKVDIVDDILSTGKSNNGYAKQDYITVKKEDDQYKLNIGNYIETSEINKTTEHDGISMQVIGRNTYKDYEEYIIKVTNHTENNILLDRRVDPKTLFIQDSKEVHYSSYSHELTESMLTIPSGRTKEITIKFYSSYNSTKNIEYIVFSDLIMYDNQGRISKKIEFKANI